MRRKKRKYLNPALEDNIVIMIQHRRETPLSPYSLRVKGHSYLIQLTKDCFPGGYNGLKEYIKEKIGKLASIHGKPWTELSEREQYDELIKIILEDEGYKEEPIRTKFPNGWWKNADRVKSILEKLVQPDGYMPPPTQIGKLSGYLNLPTTLDDHYGGYHAACTRFGLKVKTTPRGGMRDDNYVAQKLREVMSEHGFDCIPLKSWFEENHYSGLMKGIQNCGGLTKFRILFGEIKQDTLEEFLKRYIGDD